MHVSGSTSTIPKDLQRVMQDTIGSSVPSLYRIYDQNSKRLNEIFKEKVLQAPINEKLLSELQLKSESKEAKEIQFLHTLFNDPDSAKVSEINSDKEAVAKFQELMKASYKMARKTCEVIAFSGIAFERPEKKKVYEEFALLTAASPREKDEKPSSASRHKAISLSDSDESEKTDKFSIDELADEELAKKLQAEFDREADSLGEGLVARKRLRSTYLNNLPHHDQIETDAMLAKKLQKDFNRRVPFPFHEVSQDDSSKDSSSQDGSDESSISSVHSRLQRLDY
jgi:hypothetical protein